MRFRGVLLVALGALLLAAPASAMHWLDDPPGHVLTVPDDIVTDATGPDGAAVSYTVSVEPNDVEIFCEGPLSGSTFAIGEPTTISCTAGEAADSFTITVQDTTPPTVSAPADVTEISTDHDGKAVSYEATASDVVDGSLTPTCAPASGSTFLIGTTTVTCSATDTHGNTGSDTLTVTVTFNDVTAPTFTPNPPPTITTTTPSPGGTSVTYSVSAADDSGAAPTVACTPSSGSTFAVGDTTVSCTATDAAGHETTAGFTVTVTLVDTSAPSFSNVPADKVVEANGAGGSIASYGTPTATDNLDGPIADVSCSPASGSLFPLGVTSVTCSATDAHSNTGTASFSVSVLDRTKPTLIVPAGSAAYANSAAGLSADGYGLAQFLAGAHATDLVDPHPHVFNDAGEYLGVGVHVVTFTAVDASGNFTAKTALFEVRPQPPAGTPPLPLPPPRTAPANVTNFKAVAGDVQVSLTWQLPAGVDHVVVTRTLTAGGDAQTIYTGKGSSYIDRSVANGLEYRYLIVSVSPSGDESSGVAATALPKRALLRSPKDGARLARPPKLLWVKNSEAAYYNVQLFRGKTKILSTWPVGASLALKHNWKYQGRTYTLTRGTYRWYVWPGFGARRAVDYGELLGSRTFRITR